MTRIIMRGRKQEICVSAVVGGTAETSITIMTQFSCKLKKKWRSESEGANSAPVSWGLFVE